MLATPTIIRHTSVFVLKGSAAAKSVFRSRFYYTLRCRYLLSDMPKKYENRAAVTKVTANVIGAHYFESQFHVQDALSAFTR